ncbi:hypothetical protein [Bacillus weihaiensis]|nr:hypothetical protein [Bacillus weihaiensis]
MFLVNEKPELSGDISMEVSHFVWFLFFVTTFIVYIRFVNR